MFGATLSLFICVMSSAVVLYWFVVADQEFLSFQNKNATGLFYSPGILVSCAKSACHERKCKVKQHPFH